MFVRRSRYSSLYSNVSINGCVDVIRRQTLNQVAVIGIVLIVT